MPDLQDQKSEKKLKKFLKNILKYKSNFILASGYLSVILTFAIYSIYFATNFNNSFIADRIDIYTGNKIRLSDGKLIKSVAGKIVKCHGFASYYNKGAIIKTSALMAVESYQPIIKNFGENNILAYITIMPLDVTPPDGLMPDSFKHGDIPYQSGGVFLKDPSYNSPNNTNRDFIFININKFNFATFDFYNDADKLSGETFLGECDGNFIKL